MPADTSVGGTERTGVGRDVGGGEKRESCVQKNTGQKNQLGWGGVPGAASLGGKRKMTISGFIYDPWLQSLRESLAKNRMPCEGTVLIISYPGCKICISSSISLDKANFPACQFLGLLIFPTIYKVLIKRKFLFILNIPLSPPNCLPLTFSS